MRQYSASRQLYAISEVLPIMQLPGDTLLWQVYGSGRSGLSQYWYQGFRGPKLKCHIESDDRHMLPEGLIPPTNFGLLPDELQNFTAKLGSSPQEAKQLILSVLRCLNKSAQTVLGGCIYVPLPPKFLLQVGWAFKQHILFIWLPVPLQQC